jgi:putative uncharacterized protein (fragment)
MPNKVTYTITTADGKEHQVSKENVDKYGIQSYADAYKGATIRMRDAQKGDYDIPLQHFDNARKQGLHAFSLEHTPVQKQAAPKPTPTPTAKPTPSPSVHPRQSTPQVSKPLLSDSFGKGTGTDFLKPKPVGYNLSEEHRNEVLGEQAKRSATPSNPHVQRAIQLGNEAKAKRVEREQKRFGKPTIAKAFDDAVHGDKKAAKELGMPQVMQQKKDEIDYMQATGKELRNPVDAGLTYDENGDVVHSMFAPTVARDEHGNIVTNEAGEPLVGISSDEARAKAYGDSVQTGIEAQREKTKVDNLYKDAVESVNDAFDEDYKKKEAFRKEHPFLGAVSDALEGFSNRGNALQYTPEGAKPGLSALGMLSKAAIAKNNADRYGDAGTLSRLYGGIMAGLTDVNTYDFGMTDTFNAANLYRAAKNYEEGKATAKDKMLLDAAAIANNVQSEASDKLGGAFGAGQNLVGTIGFMAQMATNPASGVGKETAASVAKTVAKRALQKFGKGAIAKAVTGLAKGATRVGMDAVEAGVVTGMYSPTKIVGDYLNRKTGDVQSDGKGGYIFQNKEYSDVKALAKAINGQYAENISEMWGEYLPGVGKVNAAIGRGARKIGLGKVVDAFEHMSSSNWAKTWKNFQERTKWNGMAGEYFEEVANNLYNAVTNGDMTLDTDPHTGVFNPKINLDTFYSVALMSGIMSGVNTAGYARERYKAPHEQRKADAQARSVFGERWDEYKNAIDNADEKQIGSVMEKIGSDKSLSNSQKIAALQYQYRTAVVHGVNAQDTKNKLEGQFNAMDEAYSMGYNLQDEKELNNTAILYDEAKKQATKATGWGEDTLESMIGKDGGASTLAYMKHSDEFNDEQLQAFTDYANARAAYNGMIQRVKDDIDTKVHESELVVDQRTNLDTGAIHPATMKVDDRQVYIVNGNVVMLPDGSGVDHEHSDDFVVLRDAETGELETADPSAIFKVDAPINVQEEKEAAADNIRQTFAQQQADKIDGKLEFKQGDTYSIIDKEDGTQHSLSIIGDAINEKTGQVNPEMVLVDIDGAQQPILLPKEQVQQQVDEARRAAVAATQVVENAPTTNTNNTYSINDEVTLSDENGNTVRGSITAPENEDGKFEVYTEQPINGKKVNLFSAEELDTMTKAPTDVVENTTTQQPQQQEETEKSAETEAPQRQTTALERIPKDESGQPLYEQTEPETAWDAIVEQTEGDTSMAQTVADDMVSDLEAGVKKAEKTKAKSGGSIAEKIAAEKERAAVIEQAKATLAHWRNIAAVNRMREAAIQAEEQRKADEVARVRKEQEEKERVEQEEAERIKRENLNGVPDFVEDKATDARARGYRRVNGDKVDRQEPINATKGKEVQVKFDDNNIPTGHVAIIEANQLQPSHKNGQRNPQHFIDEAQPKERKDDASVGAARKIAANIRPEEITSSITAYTGAPTVNSRGEVIQGNNRSAALREMWDNHQEQGDKYKQYLIDHAESFGLRPEDIAAMDKPVLVNILDVNDDEAISLGQFVASDTESGGTERIKPKNVVKKLGDKMKNFANILLRANDENISFAELVDSNGVSALKWLNANGVISPTQYKSAFDSKGNITAEAKNDIKGIMYQSIFEGGNTQLEEMFNTLPAKAQKAILATAYRDYDSPQSERMIGDIQDSIMAYYALSHDSMFMNAKNHKDARIAVEAWRRQLAFDDVTGESYLPAEKYSNFALLLATMYKGDNQSLIQGTFNKMYDLIQGTQEETLFGQPDNTPRSLAQAIKETLNIEYNGQQGSNVLAGDNSASQEGRTGSNGDATSRGRSEDIDGAEANQGGTEGDTGKSGSGQSSGGSQEEVATENSHLTKKEAADFIAQMELGADVAQEIPLTIENWDKEFGGDGIVSTPIGDVKMGENQFAKLMRAGRNGKLGMLKPTLEYPDAIVEENSKAKEGTHTERPSSFIFIKSFRKSDGTRYYYFTSITVSVDGKEVVVSNQEKSRNRILRLLMEGSVIWRTPKDATTSSAEKQGLDYVHPDKAEGETKGSVITPQNTPSVGKDKQSSATKQEIVDNYLEKPASGEDLFAMAERVAEEDKAKRTRKKEEAKVDTNPTEAQKEAGNYKKGHIKVDGFNVTIEQPKGSVRRGKDANGKEWETEMHNTYGYIRGTESVDGDHIDIFLSDNPTEGNVFVIDQVNKDGSFDEHKVMYGFSDMESARKAYLSNYEEGWQGLGNITEVSKEEFKKWIDSSKRKTKPFAEYSSVKTEGDVNVQHPIEDKGSKRLVSNERYEELKKRMRSKLGQLNLGVDPEMLAIGAEMAVYHIENGARAFGAYAKEMISDLGDAIRPYLKAFYNGARDLPEMTELSSEMTPYDEVTRFDVATIGNEGEQLTPSAIETAEQINNEATVEFNAKQEQNNTNELEDVDNDAYSITKQHNNKKDVDIWVVRGKERTDKDVYTQRKQVAKEHNGYYSSFRGVNGFVFNSAEEAHSFADAIFNTHSEENHAQISEEIMRKDILNREDTENQEKKPDEDIASKEKITDRKDAEEPTEQSTNSRLLAQYNALKEKYPDTKILLRVGDFYETYQDDAKDLSKTLGIVLTKRNDGVNMVGFPYHTLDTYLPKLIRAGYRVAINDKDETANDTPTSNGLEGRFTSVEDIEGIFGKTFVNDETGAEIKVGHFTSPYKIAVKINGQVSIEEWRHLAKTLNKEEWQEKIVPDLHGFNIGDKVMYKGKEATLYDIDRSDNNRPILDTGLAPVMYDVAYWEELSPVTKSEEAIPTKEEKVSTEKEKPAKKNNSKKKDVSLKREPTVGDLFGDLFDNNDLDSKDNDTARTRQAESSSRENGTVGSISTERDGVLDTRSTGTADGEETARVSDTAGTVADGERKELLGQRSSRSTSRGNHGDGEAERPLSERGQRIGDRDDANGRSAIARATDESQRTPRSTAGTSEQLVHGEARRGGRGRNVASAKQPEPKFKRNYLYPENSSEVDNMTPQQRLRSNVEALEVVRTLMKEGREATADERDVLGRYRGWGGVDLGRAYSTHMMRGSSNGRWGTQTENDKLLSRLADIIDELDPDGKRGVLSAINRAALTSYYTPTAVAKTLNNFVELAGFKGGNMLDPSMGSGIFEGTMSKAVQQRTMIHGIELDWLTGQIARNLYPDANVLVTGYEQAGTADNAYDVVMSNIPFGDLSVTDKTWKHDSSPVRKAAQNRIHNYFAVKMLDNTRPGGLCVIMTSNAILDTKSNQIIREHLADKAEVLGVVRLPDNTFKGAGTSVVTDVILLRKYKNEADRIETRGNDTYTTNIEKPFLSSGELQLKNPTDGKTYNVSVNGYFTKNKDMMIGDGKAGGQYRADEFGLSSAMSTDEIAKSIRNLVEKRIVADRKGKLFDTHKTEREVKQAVSEAYKGDGNYISSGNVVEQDGMIGVVTSTKNKYGDVTTTFNEIPSLKGKAERIEAMLPIRKAMKQLIDMQIQGVDNNHLEEARTELQNTYDAFVKKYGRLNDKANDFLTEDIDGYTLRSLEKYKDSKFIGLSDIFTKNTIKPALDMTTAKTPQDAISLSLAEYGEIKPSFMKDVLGENWVEQCGDTLFKTPFTEDEYETVDAYLSGDVKTKLEQARTAAKEDATLQRNVDALEAVQPKDIPFEDISIRMGARWIPAEVYTDFMYEQFGIPKYIHRGNKSGVEYLPEVDQYVVNVEKKELGGEADAWRTSRRSASEVFTAALQDKSLSVFDTIKEGGKETKVLNKEETELLNNKIQDLRTAFEDWIGQNPEREEMLMRLYNDKFNRTVLRKFDGSHLNVAGLMGKELRPHQKDAVWMLINNRGGIVDHIVGAGKTLVMQSAIMEMRRMGIAKKPMIIALKSTVAQIAKEFRESYPAARILAPTEKDFAANNRKKFMAQIALNDYDCVILSHDQYNMLPHTEEVERSVIDEQMAQLDNAIEFLYGQDDKSQLTKKQIKGLEKRKNNLETKLTNLLDRKIDREFTFEGLGVDYLFVDECQHFKSLPYVSTYDRVAGLGDKKGSQKSIALLNGVRYLQKMHQGDQGTVFLSGTTISNSLSEIYHLLNYLRPSEMEQLGMITFDAWAGNFAIHTAELEYGVTSELKEKDRFRSLTNIPELAKMYAEIADVRNDMNLKLPKPKMRSHIVTVPQTDLMQEINREIVNMVKGKDGSYFNITSNDNTPWGLLASTLSAKAAINPRLIDESWETEGGKIPAVCENVKKIYDQFAEQKGTQLIFCDTGVPGKGKKYDAYSDIINRLVNDYGIPRKEIADIHEANTDEKRKELFAKVNDGSVRILIGGTKNMGTGVNVQKRIVAMHHVDVPWTPADREQREGRGVRQGNEIARDFNDDNVDVYFYATEGSLDMYKYQLQETKGKLFAQFKSGTIGDRTFDEGDAEENFDPSEVVAMLSGNPVIFEKSKQDKKVEKLRRAKRAYESDWQRRHARYEELQTKKRNYERLLSLNASDVRGLERGGFTADAEGKYPSTVTVSVMDDYSSRKTFDKPKEAGAYIHELLKENKRVQLSGFQQTANISIPITDAGLFGKPVAELESYGGIKYAVEVSDDDTAAGVAFRNLLQKVYSNKKVYERKIEDVNNQLKSADPGENAYPKQAELDEALKEKKRLDEEYRKLSDEEDKSSTNDDTRYRDFDEEKLREGYGSYNNTELSLINDPVAKMLGKSKRSEEDNKAFAERERQRMISRISELADRLHLDNIETVTNSNSLQGKKAKAKGFYSKSSGKITIVIPNHASVEDVEKTLLHEAVAHYGLRKLFGEHFETFLDNVYQNVEPEIRRIITSQAANNNWDFRTATEEYLAGLAERTDFERVHYAIWNKIKSLFLKMLHSIGFEGWSATELSDNELRYLLWRSYENMKEPGRYRSILGEAEDIAKQNELKVGNYDQQDTNSSNVAERGILYRDDDSKEKERVNAREQYEQRVNRAMFQTQEALQDSMLGLKEAMNAITKAEGKNVNIEDIDGYENAYLGENRLSSVNKAEADAFAHLLFKPMLAEVSKLCKNAQERTELVDYMMAKHGLERNAVMRKRAIEDILNNEKLSDAQKSARAGLAEYRDYAGLTALTGKDNVTEAEVDAETMVSEYENTHDTTNLWDKVNAVNAAILSKSYECGMMDKDTYEKISDMYKYYIPLRGFDETTSEEAYAYLLHQSSAFNAPIKVAKGRSSKADDPFANMQSMAESAITQGNRNKLVKQRFFNFVLNHPSDLVSINDIWLKYDDVSDEWKPVFPDNFEENDSAEDIEQKLKEFEDKMKKLAEQAPDKYKHGKETTNIPYRVVDSRDLHQHQVLVKRGGRDYILTLNGNPRAAQALNGQTNPDNDTSGAIGAILKAGEMVNRQLSAFYTTRNPDFVVSNFIRDMLFSNSIVWVKESPNYALRFHRNIARCNPAQIKVLLAKHRKGTLDMNNKLEHMFYQFMMNGGETGYANVRDIEQHKNDIRRELKRANGKLSITKAFNLLGEKLDEYNRAVENCARFAAYLTSREMGRTVERSIYDAKEISVNFNKKGSGAKFMNAVGQTKIGTTSAFVSGIGRSGFVFWNAAIQGTTNFGRQFKKHPAKAFTASAIMFLLGAVIAGIGMGDGDDDADANSYWNLPEYVRRSNILFKIGDQWVSIPLPVEYRAIYGMGELMVSDMSGKEHFTGSELGKAIAGQATQVLPIDFLEGGGGVKAFVPSAVKPFAEVYSNKGWTGMPIYKDTPYNKYMPEWTKAYKSANKYLVGIAKTLNESTGGDAYTKGSVDINPAQIEYLLNGYFGGVSGTIDKLSKSAETIAGDREYDPRNFLLLNRILKNGDERTEARAINNEYMRVKEEHDVLKARMKHYENDTDKGLFDYADKIDFLYNSPEFARYEIFEDYSKDIDALYQELKEANDGAEHLSIEKELTEVKKEMIEEMNKTRK